ncbi:hypothetical protein CUJ83_10115 [Methanocella sp. CWC-04]|uniref:histidine kinase n=1 Tax=Methanooceanicella nereidis TaxID=2052831 RepID=A0AAP2RD58_9EURY|nr:PAS domain S-box protein [Methanocella sp. CWC-04]MCD1295354.1 hypothetical protein [Methanocella sp. CWC-04]
MKIRTQLIISIVIFCSALLIIAATMLMTDQQVSQLNRQQELVTNIELGAGELGYLSNDFILYNEKHQLDRWSSKYAEFSDDISKLSVNTPEQQVLVNNIKASQQRLKSVFDDVVLTLQDENQVLYSSDDKAYIQISWSRLAVQTRSILFDASRLSQMLEEQENHVKQTNNMIIMSLLGAFGAFILLDYWLVFGGVIKSIGDLKAGTKIIGSGNLDHTIKARKVDEISELADAFNEMTTRLKNVTASKADLEREIAERKDAEEALRESEEKFRSAFANAAIGFAMAAPDGRFVDANPAYCMITGYSIEELRTQMIRNLIHPDDLEENMRLIDRMLTGEIPDFVIENRYFRKDGTFVWVRKSVSVVRNAEGAPQWIISLIENITERKLADERLKEAKDQAELYVDLMGHDINNMNHSATGYLELALDTLKMEGNLRPDDKLLLEKPIQALINSSRLIDNVRKLQKLMTQGIKTRPVDLHQIFEELGRLSYYKGERDVTINIPPVPHYRVEANELLSDVFNNLISNAIKHSDGAKSLIIDVRVEPVIEDGRSYYKCTVEDNGPGIPDAVKDKIFYRFQRGDTKAHGKGLGLFLVRTLVEGYQGKVWAEDRVPGDHTKGVRFIVMLPAVEK